MPIPHTCELVQEHGQDGNTLAPTHTYDTRPAIDHTFVQHQRDLGSGERIKGDHHIFTMSGADEILNLQPTGGKEANPEASAAAAIDTAGAVPLAAAPAPGIH